MAAPTPEDKMMNKLSDDLSSLVSTNDEDSESGSGDQALDDYVIGYIEKEVGSDVKSLKNVAAVIEKLTAENKLLEEQVGVKRLQCWLAS